MSNYFTITQQFSAGPYRIAYIHIQDPPPAPPPNTPAPPRRITDILLILGLNAGQRQGQKLVTFDVGEPVFENVSAAEVDMFEAIFKD